jgi:hypothetical protein
MGSTRWGDTGALGRVEAERRPVKTSRRPTGTPRPEEVETLDGWESGLRVAGLDHAVVDRRARDTEAVDLRSGYGGPAECPVRVDGGSLLGLQEVDGGGKGDVEVLQRWRERELCFNCAADLGLCARNERRAVVPSIPGSASSNSALESFDEPETRT